MATHKCLLNGRPLREGLKRQLSTSNSHNYKGTWANPRRVQNPTLLKQQPTLEFVSESGLKRSSSIYTCGFGAVGSLGLPRYYQPLKEKLEDIKTKDAGTRTFRRLRSLISSDKPIDVACGYGFTVIAAQIKDSSHTAVGFGINTHSQLGYQYARPGFPLEIVATPAPIVLPTSKPITKVSCGRSHTILLNSDGQVFSLGNNSLGQCGRPIVEGEEYFASKKVHTLDLPPIKQIVCGQDHSIFVAGDGSLYSCGWSADGQTGLGHYENQWQPALVRGCLSGIKITRVSSQADTVLALDQEGNVYGWGNAEYSQFCTLTGCEAQQFNVPQRLKLDGVPGKIVDIAAGGTVCAILNDLGQVYVWGFGILGKGQKVDQITKPTMIPESLFGKNVYCQDTKVIQIFAGLSQLAAVTNQGDLFTWGRNRGGMLGLVHGVDQYYPMQVSMHLVSVKKLAFGVDHSCALVEKVS